MERRLAVPEGDAGFSGRQTYDGRAGESGGFGVLMPPHLPVMLRTAAALVGTADAEDAAQEAILRAWQAWESLRNPAVLRSWLLRITINVCRDWQRGRFGTRRALTLPLLDDDVLPLAMLGADPGASDHTGALDLRQAINGLDDDLRIVVVLRYYAQMDATEIGAAVGAPAATVRSRLRRALTLLRGRLSDAHEVPLSHPEKGGC